MATIFGSNSVVNGDFITPTSSGDTYRGLAGDDTYILSSFLIPAGALITISDTEGANRIQLTDGLSITSSLFTNNAVQLTLSNNAVITILGANSFEFEFGTNAVGGDTTGVSGQTYAQFAAILGVPSLPVTGTASGTPDVIITSSGVGTPSVELSADLPVVTATAEAENFVYDFAIVNGRVTNAGDNDVMIVGFDVLADKLVFNDVGTGTVYTEAEFLALPGVSVAANPFALPAPGSTTVALDPASGVSGSVVLVGILDSTDLAQINLETTA